MKNILMGFDKRPEPNFSFSMPKNRNYKSAENLAREYGMICEVYNSCGEERVGLWEKF